MTSYKITDTLTGETAWIEAPSLRAALIARENELRAEATSFPRAGKPALPATARPSHYSEGVMVDASIADVSCVGRRENVVRDAAS